MSEQISSPLKNERPDSTENNECASNQMLALVKEVIRSNGFSASLLADVWQEPVAEKVEPSTQEAFTGFVEARAAYRRGENVIRFLRTQFSDTLSDSDIIEVSYDLQAGSYVRNALQNRNNRSDYCQEMASLIKARTSSVNNLLDIGTGELTTLCELMDILPRDFVREKIYAFDISWSRLSVGLEYAHAYYPDVAAKIVPFVADLSKIPLPASSMDLVISSHAVEPNRGQQDLVIAELLRVAKHKLFLFEPCYEINSEAGKRRMDFHGYVKDLPDSIIRMGGSLSDLIPMKTVSNPLNPTACFIIDVDKNVSSAPVNFTVPGTESYLHAVGDFLWSDDSGTCFPILSGLPVLRLKHGILATAFKAND